MYNWDPIDNYLFSSLDERLYKDALRIWMVQIKEKRK